MTKLYVLDEREVWWRPMIEAAKARGYDAQRVKMWSEAGTEGVGFIRPHADPAALKRNRIDFEAMALRGLTMIQDGDQVRMYEDKSAQFEQYRYWMPPTWRFTKLADALEFLNNYDDDDDDPLVSKADQGASSVNVRVLKTREQQIAHVREVFGKGISVNCCSGGAKALQKDYVLLQQFIPHTITWRVNIVGTKMAVFKRYCGKDGLRAETGNTEPVMQRDEKIDSLLDFAAAFFAEAGTRWCAIDVLECPETEWRLLETSLAWPWPSPGTCMQAPFFGSTRNWAEIWDVMLDEYEAGVWADTSNESRSIGT